jgi:hypothetical protein
MVTRHGRRLNDQVQAVDIAGVRTTRITGDRGAGKLRLITTGGGPFDRVP